MRILKAVWLGAFLGVVLLDVDIGLIIGIVISLLTVIIKDQLLRLKQLKKYTDVYVDKDYVISKAPRKVLSDDIITCCLLHNELVLIYDITVCLEPVF